MGAPPVSLGHSSLGWWWLSAGCTLVFPTFNNQNKVQTLCQRLRGSRSAADTSRHDRGSLQARYAQMCCLVPAQRVRARSEALYPEETTLTNLVTCARGCSAISLGRADYWPKRLVFSKRGWITVILLSQQCVTSVTLFGMGYTELCVPRGRGCICHGL